MARPGRAFPVDGGAGRRAEPGVPVTEVRGEAVAGARRFGRSGLLRSMGRRKALRRQWEAPMRREMIGIGLAGLAGVGAAVAVGCGQLSVTGCQANETCTPPPPDA